MCSLHYYCHALEDIATHGNLMPSGSTPVLDVSPHHECGRETDTGWRVVGEEMSGHSGVL